MASSAVETFYSDLAGRLGQLSDDGLYKTERVISSPQGARVRLLEQGREIEVLNVCSNDYLGLANDPRINAAAAAAMQTWGLGLSSVRFICGTQVVHKALEDRISAFVGKEDTILFPSCFDANAGFFEAMMGEGDHIISDQLNHASIIDGIRLSKAARSVYRNGDLGELEQRLRQAAGARCRLIVTDGVFSMDGVIAPLPGIADLAARYDAMVYVDDSHGLGVIGPGGGGTLAYHGIGDRIDFVAGTLGKALGGASGGFISGRREAVSVLRQSARPYLFSNTIAPPLAVAALVALDILDAEPWRLDRLRILAARLRDGLQGLGFSTLGADHPIVPVLIGDSLLNARLGDALREGAVHAAPFSYPVVPRGAARIRLQVSANHTESDIDQLLDLLATAGRRLSLIQ